MKRLLGYNYGHFLTRKKEITEKHSYIIFTYSFLLFWLIAFLPPWVWSSVPSHLIQPTAFWLLLTSHKRFLSGFLVTVSSLNPETPDSPIVLNTLQPLLLSTFSIFIWNYPSIFIPLPFIALHCQASLYVGHLLVSTTGTHSSWEQPLPLQTPPTQLQWEQCGPGQSGLVQWWESDPSGTNHHFVYWREHRHWWKQLGGF